MPSTLYLHERIAAALGWPIDDVRSMSLPTLRDLVRPHDAKLARDIGEILGEGSHVAVSKGRPSGKHGAIKADVSWLGPPPTAAESARYEVERAKILAGNVAEGRPSLPPGSRRG